MAILNKLRSVLGGESGRMKADKAKLERQIAAWEEQRAKLQKEQDELKAKLKAKVEKARTLDPKSAAYAELRHEAMVIQPEIEMLSGHLSRLMANIEKYHKVLSVYRTSELTKSTQLNESELTKMSVMIEEINDSVEAAADLDQEFDEVIRKSDQIHHRMAEQAARTEDTFFDALVRDTEEAAPAEDDPFARMIAEANDKAAAETPAASDTPAEPAPLADA